VWGIGAGILAVAAAIGWALARAPAEASVRGRAVVELN
jgi:hypothetical protein